MRYISRMPVVRSIVKLGYSMDGREGTARRAPTLRWLDPRSIQQDVGFWPLPLTQPTNDSLADLWDFAV